MNEIQSKRGKVAGFAMVYLDGVPQFDDIFNIPKSLWDYLTPVEKEYIENVRNASRNTS